MYYIGVDLGTSSIKVILMAKNGEILNSVSKEYPLYIDDKSWSEQDPNDWYNQFLASIKELIVGVDTNDIKAMSFSGQMHGMVALDKNDNVIRNAILWNDQRTVEECKWLNNTIGKENLLKHVGNVALTGFTLPKILWMKNNEPELFSKACKFMLPKDFLAYKISGVFATDYSDASGTMLLDVEHKCYSKYMIDIAGIDEKMLPQLFESYQCIGHVTEEISALCGLSTSTKVVIGGGDQAVGAIGTGTVKNNECSISLGTSGVVFVASDNYKVDTEKSSLHSFCHANGKYHLMGVTLAAAGATKWWAEEIIKESHVESQSNISNIGDNNIIFLPYLTGERSPINNPNARGVFVGMTTTTKREDMTLAVLEGVAFSLSHILTRINELGIQISSARIIGGGAKSKLWCQIISNCLNIRVENINSEEGPAFGAAILAAVGDGAYETVEVATSAIIKSTTCYEPEAELSVHYKNKFEKYLALYKSLESFFDM